MWPELRCGDLTILLGVGSQFFKLLAHPSEVSSSLVLKQMESSKRTE